jgi:hypothetical protein
MAIPIIALDQKKKKRMEKEAGAFSARPSRRHPYDPPDIITDSFENTLTPPQESSL